MASPAVAGIERDVAGTDEQGDGGEGDEADGQRCAVIEELEADEGIQQENPGGGNDGPEVNARKRLSRVHQRCVQGRWNRS